MSDKKLTEADLLVILETARYALGDDDILQDIGTKLDLSVKEMDRVHRNLILYLGETK